MFANTKNMQKRVSPNKYSRYRLDDSGSRHALKLVPIHIRYLFFIHVYCEMNIERTATTSMYFNYHVFAIPFVIHRDNSPLHFRIFEIDDILCNHSKMDLFVRLLDNYVISPTISFH